MKIPEVKKQSGSINVSTLIKENNDLKTQRDDYATRFQKNEEMLIKARDLISHLKADIHLDGLS